MIYCIDGMPRPNAAYRLYLRRLDRSNGKLPRSNSRGRGYWGRKVYLQWSAP